MRRFLFKCFLIFVFLMSFCALLTQTSYGRIRIGDELEITVYGEPDLSARPKVAMDGAIDYLRIGRIKAAGLTSKELESLLQDLLGEYYRYLSDPKVKITVLSGWDEPRYPKKEYYYPQEAWRQESRGDVLSSQRRGTFSIDLKPTYQLTAGDRIQISVFGEPDFDRTVIVSEKGTINYPPLGEIFVEGLVIEEVIRKLETLLGKDYFVDPKISAVIVKYGKFSVQGEVELPGSFELSELTTLVDALIFAGGATKKADLSRIKVYRTHGQVREEEFTVDLSTQGAQFYLKPMDRVVVEGRGKIYIVGAVNNPGNYDLVEEAKTLDDVLTILAGGMKESANISEIEVVRKDGGRTENYILDLLRDGDFSMREDDRVIVDEYGSISIFGEVKNPGSYLLKEDTTAVGAIAMAGGFTEDAAQNAVKIIRKSDKGEKITVVPVAYILSRGDMSKDIDIKEGDVIVIPESWF